MAHAAGFLRNFCKFSFAELSRARALALAHQFRHAGPTATSLTRSTAPAARSDDGADHTRTVRLPAMSAWYQLAAEIQPEIFAAD
jgi:hypothetical protein